jgi:glucose/arabinose dehydrogenase
LFSVLSVTLILQACGGGGGDSPATSATDTSAPPSSAGSITLSAASINRPVEVPSAALASPPFDSAKSLLVPPGFGIRVWARVNGARFMAVAPNGDVLVSLPNEGKVVLLRERSGDVPQQFDFATGMSKPQDMVFHTIGSTTYLYISESNQVTRSVYQSGDTQSATRETVVANLPNASEQGTYDHALKDIAIGPDDKLYVAIGSSCNACTDDAADPTRATIFQYNLDGTNGHMVARGIRNAEGLDFLPGTNTLWVTINERDDVEYPYDNDFDGDGVSDLGKVIPAYVNDNPPDLFTSIRDGGNYGWPYCNPVPNAAMNNLDMVHDVEFNGDDSKLDCATADKPVKGLHAHVAPLGFSFLQNSAVPAAYRSGAAIAQHGCWDCTTLNAGYKVSYVPFDGAGNAGAEMDLVTGFVTDPVGRTYWGRPVDVIADTKGNLLISDDYAGAIYQLYPLTQ